MQASIVDLRYKMKDVLRALKRKEAVYIHYHGKQAGVILPAKVPGRRKITSHPFFGVSRKEASAQSVAKEMENLRGLRYHAF